METRKQEKAGVNNSRTRKSKAKAQENYTEANREVMKSIRNDKRNNIDNLADEADDASIKWNMNQLYGTTRQQAGKFSKLYRKTSVGQGWKGDSDKAAVKLLNRWTEHFDYQLLNTLIQAILQKLNQQITKLIINCDRPSKPGKQYIKLSNGKAPGPDDIPAVALKADIDNTVELLYPLFKKIWGEEAVSSG